MPRQAAAALEMLAAVLIGVAAVAAAAGPLRAEFFGQELSVRTLSRPLTAALALLVARGWLLRGTFGAAAALALLSRVALGALIAAGVAGWVAFASTTVGGADSYGYVSAADRLRAGRLIQDEPLARLLPFPDATAASVPLGYVPAGRVPHASVPAYPLGLPALMATATALFGASGPFLVAPLMGLLLIGAAWWLARAWSGDRETALLAAAWLAVNPLTFTYAIQPMSDVPAAALVLAAMAASTWQRPWLAGLAATLALLVRPALAPAALALAAVPILAGGRRDARQAMATVIPVLGGFALAAWLQWYLYGDARASGYGAIADLFSTAPLATNARIFGHWSWMALGPIWLGAALVGLAAVAPAARAATLLVGAAVAAPYLFYRPYDHWETLRFLLPAMAPATVVAAAGLLLVTRRLAGAAGGFALATAIVVFTAASWTAWLSANQVFTMPVHEARHRLAAELVAQATPPAAVIVAQQHSGSVRHYAGRLTITWDRVPPGALPATVRSLRAHGFPVYLLLDDEAERAMFAARHGNPLAGGGWLPAGQRRSVQLLEATDP